MSKQQMDLIRKAWQKWHNIYPVPSAVSFADPVSFTHDHHGRLVFWFDTEDRSTRIVVDK